MISFEMLVIMAVAGVGVAVAMMARAHGRYASDWFFQGVLVGVFLAQALFLKNRNL